MISRTQKEFSDEEILRIADAFDDFRDGKEVDSQGFSKVCTIAEISKQDYMLTPGRYVGERRKGRRRRTF